MLDKYELLFARYQVLPEGLKKDAVPFMFGLGEADESVEILEALTRAVAYVEREAAAVSHD